MSMNLGIQFQPLSMCIDAGPLNKQGTRFLDKQDVTDSAVMAVIEYIHHEFDGAMITDTNTGTAWHVQVTKIGENG